jgi:hypothetical protein
VRRPREPERVATGYAASARRSGDRGDAETGAMTMMCRELSWESSCADEDP